MDQLHCATPNTGAVMSHHAILATGRDSGTKNGQNFGFCQDFVSGQDSFLKPLRSIDDSRTNRAQVEALLRKPEPEGCAGKAST